MKRIIILLSAIGLTVSCMEKTPTEPVVQKEPGFDFTLIIKDASDNLAKGATVTLFTEEQPEEPVQQKTATSEGKAVFKDLPAGKYLAKAIKHGISGQRPITISEIQENNQMELYIGIPDEDQDKMALPHDFQVSLKNYHNVPLSGRKLDLFSNEEMELIATVVTDDHGEAVFTALPRGHYDIQAYNSLGETVDDPATTIAVVLDDQLNTAEIKVNALLHDPDIIITGAMVDPKGSDCPKSTASSTSGTFTLYHDKGGYEYIQLMALKDIDFSQTPYCVITGMCAGSDQTYGTDGNGWVESIGKTDATKHHKTTYQMNLTSGKVSAGEIFYVGGESRMIASYYVGGGNGWYSAQIEEDRWWGFDFYNQRGDNDNGAAKGGSGIFNNFNSDKKTNVPDGIAVFNTTEVDKNTVPIDCVFYGGDSKPRTTDHFTICDNDLYSTTDLEGNEQKYFASGTNTWFMRQDFHDNGCYFMMGGHWCKGEWVKPRTGTPVELNVSKGFDSVTPDTIEKAEGVTQVTL